MLYNTSPISFTKGIINKNVNLKSSELLDMCYRYEEIRALGCLDDIKANTCTKKYLDGFELFIPLLLFNEKTTCKESREQAEKRIEKEFKEKLDFINRPNMGFIFKYDGIRKDCAINFYAQIKPDGFGSTHNYTKATCFVVRFMIQDYIDAIDNVHKHLGFNIVKPEQRIGYTSSTSYYPIEMQFLVRCISMIRAWYNDKYCDVYNFFKFWLQYYDDIVAYDLATASTFQLYDGRLNSNFMYPCNLNAGYSTNLEEMIIKYSLHPNFCTAPVNINNTLYSGYNEVLQNYERTRTSVMNNFRIFVSSIKNNNFVLPNDTFCKNKMNELQLYIKNGESINKMTLQEILEKYKKKIK